MVFIIIPISHFQLKDSDYLRNERSLSLEKFVEEEERSVVCQYMSAEVCEYRRCSRKYQGNCHIKGVAGEAVFVA